MEPATAAEDGPNDPKDPEDRQDSSGDPEVEGSAGPWLDQFRGVTQVGNEPDREPGQQGPQTASNEMSGQGDSWEARADRLSVCDPG